MTAVWRTRSSSPATSVSRLGSRPRPWCSKHTAGSRPENIAVSNCWPSTTSSCPDTPPMALHRGRIELLEEHLRRDPDLLTRTFAHADIYPPSLGCHADEWLAGHGTPL